jgi:hypothetical protein
MMKALGWTYDSSEKPYEVNGTVYYPKGESDYE